MKDDSDLDRQALGQGQEHHTRNVESDPGPGVRMLSSFPDLLCDFGQVYAPHWASVSQKVKEGVRLDGLWWPCSWLRFSSSAILFIESANIYSPTTIMQHNEDTIKGQKRCLHVAGGGWGECCQGQVQAFLTVRKTLPSWRQGMPWHDGVWTEIWRKRQACPTWAEGSSMCKEPELQRSEAQLKGAQQLGSGGGNGAGVGVVAGTQSPMPLQVTERTLIFTLRIVDRTYIPTNESSLSLSLFISTMGMMQYPLYMVLSIKGINMCQVLIIQPDREQE